MKRRDKKVNRRPRRDYIPKEQEKDIMINVELESEINELYAKTKVIQKFKNPSDNNLELKIYVGKKEGLIFSSFSAKIGESIMVKSKIIQKKKVEEKYTDAISGGNAAIFVTDDTPFRNRFIINMGNIPPKEEVTFISEFLHLIQTSKSYEFELFRDLPVFEGRGVSYKNSKLQGNIHIKTANKLFITKKEILMDNLKIVKEEYENKEKNKYYISYEIGYLENSRSFSLEYMPSSKIYFDVENNDNKPIVYTQKSIFDKNEQNYYVQYKIKRNELEEENNKEEKPALFIFLLDQSGSMAGSSIKIASQALKLFIQSLPAKSYYQIIGFGSRYVIYDDIPKEYIQKNIDETIATIEKLKADLGGTDIYKPLKHIYDSYDIYDKINLPKNIFLLTDGEIEDKDKTLKLIEKNSNRFTIFSIGIGRGFDKDLIKNAGILGKGNYNFCEELDGLNTIIANEINKAISPYISKLEINTSLDEGNIIKNNNNIPNIIREDEIINLNYVNKKNDKNELSKIEIKYVENDKNIEKKYEVIPIEINEGEELSKLIINNYISNEKNLSKENKLKLALKYQLYTDCTSLFAEVELSEKIDKEMKSRIIGKKNVIYKEKHLFSKYDKNDREYKKKSNPRAFGGLCRDKFGDRNRERSRSRDRNRDESRSESLENKLMAVEESVEELVPKRKSIITDNFKKNEIEPKTNNKEEVMKILNTQNFIQGFWNENKETKYIKEKYKKEFDLLKKLKKIKISDQVAMTILVIYFIYKEHPELLAELSRIIKKAKLYITKETNNSYDNIIKEINI